MSRGDAWILFAAAVLLCAPPVLVVGLAGPELASWVLPAARMPEAGLVGRDLGRWPIAAATIFGASAALASLIHGFTAKSSESEARIVRRRAATNVHVDGRSVGAGVSGGVRRVALGAAVRLPAGPGATTSTAELAR